jgi:hypothetical protein
MSATAELMALDPQLSLVQWDKYIRFRHGDCLDLGDPTGIHVEEGEFLYGLIRMLKPKSCLETGTNIGVSTMYTALALHHNGQDGMVRTIEHDTTVAKRAAMKFKKMGLDDHITLYVGKVQDFFDHPEGLPFDFAWLDTEFNQRYAELVWAFDHIVPGGVICIHDLWELDTPEYGELPYVLRDWIKKGYLRAMTFDTQHGVSIFQKRRDKDYLANVQMGLL